jgi:amine acid ABC transporter, permease protein, 3-TM region, His/Glu/Gln/Arg/opine family
MPAITRRRQSWSALALQAGFLCLLAVVLVAFLVKVHQNLAAQHVTSGFSFLWRATGWDIGYSIIPFSIRNPYWWALLAGLVNTIAVGFLGLVFATLLGLAIATMRVYGNPLIAGVAKAYVELIRNIPPLLQLFVWYAVFTSLPPPRSAWQPLSSLFFTARGIYLPGLNVHWISGVVISLSLMVGFFFLIWLAFSFRLAFTPLRRRLQHAFTAVGAMLATVILAVVLGATPDATGLIDYPARVGLGIRGGLQLPPELAALVVATICYGSAYAGEVIRSGFLAVDAGKVEAAKALGLGSWTIFACIQMPLVISAIMPMMTNLYVWLMKATTLGIAIGFADLFMVSVSAINQSGQTIEILLIVAVVFWMLNSLVVLLMSRIAARFNHWT